MPGTPPIIGAGIFPPGTPQEDFIRQAQQKEEQLELEESYRPDMAAWRGGEDAYHGALGLIPPSPITDWLKPFVTPGRQDPNEVVTPWEPPFNPAPPPFEEIYGPLAPPPPLQPPG
jgi:hypothetical protein